MILTWEAKLFAAADMAADAAETNWKHKVTPDQGDLIKISLHGFWLAISSKLHYDRFSNMAFDWLATVHSVNIDFLTWLSIGQQQ